MPEKYIFFDELTTYIKELSESDFQEWVQRNITLESQSHIVDQIAGNGDTWNFPDLVNNELYKIMKSTIIYINQRDQDKSDDDTQKLFIEIAKGRGFRPET